MTTNDVTQMYIVKRVPTYTQFSNANVTLASFIDNAIAGDVRVFKVKNPAFIASGSGNAEGTFTAGDKVAIYVKTASDVNFGGVTKTIELDSNSVMELRGSRFRAPVNASVSVTLNTVAIGDIITLYLNFPAFGSFSNENTHPITIQHVCKTAVVATELISLIKKVSAALTNYPGAPNFGKKTSLTIGSAFDIWDNPLVAITTNGTTSMILTAREYFWAFGRGDYQLVSMEGAASISTITTSTITVATTGAVNGLGYWKQVADMEYFFKKMRGEVYDELSSGIHAVPQSYDYNSAFQYDFLDITGYASKAKTGSKDGSKFQITIAVGFTADKTVAVTRTTTVATGDTTTAHGLVVGDMVTISDANAPLSGNFVIATVPSASTFTYTVANSGSTSSSGVVSKKSGIVNYIGNALETATGVSYTDV